jgi:outer membrane lipoprotein-sorting protein
MSAARRAAVLLAALLALPAARALAQEMEILLPVSAPTAYRGRKVVIDFTHRGPQVTSMSVLCQPGGRERREMHATRGVLVIDGETAWQYLPERGVVLKRPARGEGGEVLRPEQLQRALSSYSVRVVPSERIAGRRSRALEFTPRQEGSRPRRLVWIDEETGLILRTEIYGTDQRLSWLSVFEELEYHPALDEAAFRMQVPAGVRVVESGDEPCLEPAEAERLAGLPVAMPAYLPEGFVKQCIRARRRRDYGEVQVVFGDGLSLLSLFASTSFREPAPGEVSAPAVAIGHSTGRWHDLGLVTGISWRAPWAHLALLGELSREQLHKIAGSVRVGAELSSFPGRQ